MGSLYLNRLSNDKRQNLIKTLLNTQEDNCFICGKEIDLDVHRDHIDIDHIEPIKTGGKDEPNNFAVTHDSCNRQKQASDLRVAKVLSSFEEIANSTKLENRSPNLGDVLAKYGGAKYDLTVNISEDLLKTAFSELDQQDVLRSRLKTMFFYARRLSNNCVMAI